MISEILQKKIDASIRLLQSIGKAYDGVIEIAYSGGKDSEVILQLAKEAGINYEAIYKNTTIDPPGTIAHVKKMGARIIRPKETFFQLVARKGLPSMRRRFCCEVLKEYKVLDKCVIGVRKEESTARAKRYNEPTQCRWYGAKKEENHVEQIMPILDWTNDDVKEYIIDRNIKLAPVYLDGGGQNRHYKTPWLYVLPYTIGKETHRELQAIPKHGQSIYTSGAKILRQAPQKQEICRRLRMVCSGRILPVLGRVLLS